MCGAFVLRIGERKIYKWWQHFPSPTHICALSALLGFVCVCVWVRGYVALLTQRKSQPCFIGFSTVQLVLLAVMRI